MTDVVATNKMPHAVIFTKEAITQIQRMHSMVREIRGVYGESHPVTTEAQSSFTNSLVTVLSLGGTITKDGEMVLGYNTFGFAFGMVAHYKDVPEDIAVLAPNAPRPVSFSVNS